MFKPSACLLGPLLIVLGSAGSAAAQTADPTDDAQIWNDVQFTVPLQRRTDLVLSGALRIGRDVTHLVYERGAAGVTIRANKYLSLTPLYHYIAVQPVEGIDAREHRLSLDGTFSLPLGRWILSDRNMIERRFRENDTSTRYRNRVQLERRLKNNGLEVRVFAFDEVFYSPGPGWLRNRFGVGVGRNLGRSLFLDLYYVRQNDAISRPGDLHVIGTSLKVRL